MVVTGGTFRSRKIVTINSNHLRPTSNKVRQSIFNVLVHKFNFNSWKADEAMLDAFAGSGAVTIEAISRGIKKKISLL